MEKHRLLIWLVALFFAACNSASPTAADSPGGAYRRYVEASQKQDVAAMKGLLSQSSIKMIDEAAKAEKLTVDDVLRRESTIEIKRAPETRAEKIEGDAATLEVADDAAGRFETWHFVREAGAWKIARDKYVERLRRPREDSGASPPPVAPPNTSAPGAR